MTEYPSRVSYLVRRLDGIVEYAAAEYKCALEMALTRGCPFIEFLPTGEFLHKRLFDIKVEANAMGIRSLAEPPKATPIEDEAA